MPDIHNNIRVGPNGPPFVIILLANHVAAQLTVFVCTDPILSSVSDRLVQPAAVYWPG